MPDRTIASRVEAATGHLRGGLLVCGAVIRNLSFYAIMIGATVALQVVFGGDIGALWGPYADRADAPLTHQIGLGVGCGLLVVLLFRVGSTYIRWARHLDRWFRDVLGALDGREILAMAMMSSLAEEIFFRGFLQPRLGLWLTALLFGLVHFPFERRLIPWTLSAGVMGVVFGLMVETQGTLLAAVLAHFTINFFNLHTLVRPLAREV